MPLDTYANLQTAIASTVNRDDLTAVIPDWIALAEADHNRVLRHWRMETRTTLNLTAEYVDLPSDWLEVVRLDYNASDGDRHLRLVPPRVIAARGVYAGEPTMFCLSGSQIRLWPIPASGTADLLYFQKIPALSSSNTSNWLLAEAPGAYLYGALIHSAPYLQEDDRVATWGQLYAAEVDALQNAGKRAGWTSGMRLS